MIWRYFFLVAWLASFIWLGPAAIFLPVMLLGVPFAIPAIMILCEIPCSYGWLPPRRR